MRTVLETTFRYLTQRSAVLGGTYLVLDHDEGGAGGALLRPGPAVGHVFLAVAERQLQLTVPTRHLPLPAFISLKRKETVVVCFFFWTRAFVSVEAMCLEGWGWGWTGSNNNDDDSSLTHLDSLRSNHLQPHDLLCACHSQLGILELGPEDGNFEITKLFENCLRQQSGSKGHQFQHKPH